MVITETEIIEFKRIPGEGLEKDIVAFLNTDGGTIYVGVDDGGTVLGFDDIDKAQRQISDIITDKILPYCLPLVKPKTIMVEGKQIIRIEIEKGNSLYYMKRYGRSSSGCFVRVGTTSKPLNEEEIEKRYKRTLKQEDYMKDTPASFSPISFRQLKIFYDEAGLHLGDGSMAENLELLTPDGKYNKIAELFSDKNRLGFIYARFKGLTKAAFSETVDFGGQCILVSVDKLMTRLEGENRGITTFVSTKRRTKALVDIDCLREVVYNALAHNDWVAGGIPSVYVYDDRIEVMSYGGLPIGQDEKGLFEGKSCPRSPAFMRILRDLDYAERTGHGTPQVVARYGRKAFEITDSYVLVTLPYDKEVLNQLVEDDSSAFAAISPPQKDLERMLIDLIKEDSCISYEEAAEKLNISKSSVGRLFAKLRKKGILLGKRANRLGEWRLNPDFLGDDKQDKPLLN